MESWGNEMEPTDYYGSLEHLPIAPLKGKPPPYASRRQHHARLHLQKGKRGLSSSAGDLTTTTTTTTTSSSKGQGNSRSVNSLDSDDKGRDDLGIHDPIPRHGSSGDARKGATTTPASQSHHQYHGCIAHHTGRQHDDSTDCNSSKPQKGGRYDVSEQNVTEKPLQGYRQREGRREEEREEERNATKSKTQERLGLIDTADSATDVTEGRKNASNNNTLRNYRELAAIPDHTLIAWSRSKSMSDIATVDDEDSKEEKTSTSASLGRSVEQVDYRYVETGTTREYSGIASTTSTSPTSFTPSNLPKKDSQEERKTDDDGDDDGLFVAVPVFLESPPSSSPSSSSSSSSSPQQEDISSRSKEDSAGRGDNSSLSTLRREILHLTRLKEEIERSVLQSKEVLKEEVSGLREEREGLAGAVEERERRLDTQQAEIQDLKDTVSQLQTLVLTNDGEAKLQRQASDLQEQLREEKRHRLQETTQLQREVRSLHSKLREKDDQLEQYKSSPSLSSWDSGGLGGRHTDWKTSLPDVRSVEVVMPSLGTSVAERRKSLSGTSESSDDSRSSGVESSGYKVSKTTEGVPGGSYVAPVRSYTSFESSGKYNRLPRDTPESHAAPVKSIAVETSSKPGVTSIAPTRPDSAVRSSRKSAYTPGSHLVGVRDAGKAPSDEDKTRTVKTTLYVDLDNYKVHGLRGEGYAGPGGYTSVSRWTTAAPLTKSPVSPVSRPSAIPPAPPRVTREAGTSITRPSDPPASPRLNGSPASPSHRSRLNHVTKPATTASSQVSMSPKQDSHPAQVSRSPKQDSHPAQVRSTGSSQIPRSPRLTTGQTVKTSWMYKSVEGAGGTPTEGRQRGPEASRGETGMSQSGSRGETRIGQSGSRGETGISQAGSRGETRIGQSGSRGETGISQAGSRGLSEAGRNTGGNSYISATLHCLFTLAPLRLFFREEFWGLRVRSEVAQAMAAAFTGLESGTGELRAVQCLKEAVQRRDKIFKLHKDPPAADLLSCLLAWLHSDLAPQARPAAPQASSVVSRLFHGLRESLIVCPKRRTVLSSALESFNFLTLSVPGEGAWSLQELLARRFKPQEVAWECRQCGGRHPCTHQTVLLRWPRVLVLYLRRPSGVASRVLFPDAGLTLQQQDHRRDAATARSRVYQLVGVVSQEATQGSSRYSAFCRSLEGGRWGVWAEGRVAVAARREVLSLQGAHLLFYHHQEDHQADHQAPGRAREGVQSTCV